MKKLLGVCVLMLMLNQAVQAQISYPRVRKFNVGLFLGLGGETGPVLNIVPVLNLTYRGTTLTGGVSMNEGYTIGLIHEILPLSVAHYNVKWIVSGFYSVGKVDRYYTEDTEYNSYALLTGLRLHFSNRWFSNVQGGVSYASYTTQLKSNFVSNNDKYQEWQPFFEFGIGFRLFKTFEEKKKSESTE